MAEPFLERNLRIAPIDVFVDPPDNRIRWDKPAAEAATLADMQIFVEAT